MDPTTSGTDGVAGGLAACSSATQARARHEHIRDMADFWAEAVEVASVFPQERASERVQQHAAENFVPRLSGRVPEIIIVSDAVEGTFVDLDGEQIVDMPVPQIAAKIPEVVETIPQEHISDDLPMPQVVKENLEVIKVSQERRGCASIVRIDRQVGEVGCTGTSAAAERQEC